MYSVIHAQDTVSDTAILIVIVIHYSDSTDYKYDTGTGYIEVNSMTISVEIFISQLQTQRPTTDSKPKL